jgi:hypothetical protein
MEEKREYLVKEKEWRLILLYLTLFRRIVGKYTRLCYLVDIKY